MADSDDTSVNKDVPPWLQPVPEGDDDSSFFSVSRKTIITASIAAVLIAVFVVAIVFLYKDSPREGPIRIAADAGPVKERPADAGGMNVDHQDKAVLEIGDGAKAKARVEIGEQPEQPVAEIPDLPVTAPGGTDSSGDTRTADAIGDIAEAVTKPAAQVEEKPEIRAPAATPAGSPDVQSPDVEAAGGFRVQLGAYGSETSAATSWRALKAKFPRQLGDMNPVYVPVQSGDRTLYRLRVGPVVTRSRADEICISLRAQDQACFVTGS